MDPTLKKMTIDNLALFGGLPLFSHVKPTSNFSRPDFECFYHYLKKHCRLTGETLIQELEQRLARFHQVDHCVVFNSGFWALALLIDTVALSDRKEVILPSLTYRRMADIVAWVGRVPHFCDVDPNTLANSAKTVQSCFSDKTALLIGVHPVGNHCDIDGLTQFARENNTPIIFDSVESVNEIHINKRIGAFGDAELFSLGASKLLNGFEGGYVTTNHSSLANKLRIKREGFGSGFHLSVPLPEVHAAMALSGLDDLPLQLTRNRARFERYREELKDLPELRLIEQPLATEPSHKNIVVEVLNSWPYDRDTTIQLLNAENILARAYYAPPLHQKQMTYPHSVSSLPNTDWVASHFISLPCGQLVSEQDITLIAAFLRCIRDQSEAILPYITTGKGNPPYLANSVIPFKPIQPFHKKRRQEETLRNLLLGIFQRQYYTESGPIVRRLEVEVGQLLGTSHVVCVSNPSVAWLMLMETAELRSGPLVISAIASRPLREAINWMERLNQQEAVWVAADCLMENTGGAANVDGRSATIITCRERDWAFDALTPKTLAETYNAPLFCDAATHCLSSLAEQFFGDWFNAAVFAFGKDNSVNSAYGACICTRDETLADRLRCMRGSGGVLRQVTVSKAVNGRMSEAQAAYALLSLRNPPIFNRDFS